MMSKGSAPGAVVAEMTVDAIDPFEVAERSNASTSFDAEAGRRAEPAKAGVTI